MDKRIYGNGLTDPSTGWYEEQSVKTYNFKKLLADRQRLPNNPYTWWRYDCDHPMVLRPADGAYVNENHGSATQSLYGAIRSGNIFCSVNGSSVPSYNDAVVAVTNQLATKLKSKDINLAVAMGEYAETASFVSSAMMKTAKSYRQLRKGNISGALQTLTGRKNNKWADIPNVASDMWLAYSYALRPLLSDVYGAVDLLQKRSKPFVPIEVVRTSKSGDISASLEAYGRFFTSLNGSYTCRGQIRFVVSNPLLRKLDEVGLTNPLNVAWELVPFSFVVDWFVPIGAYLDSIVPPQGVDFVDGYVSYKAKGGLSRKTVNADNPFYGIAGYTTMATSKEVVKIRAPLSSFPRFQVVVPDLSLSKSKIASGLALLWSLRK